MKIAITVPFHRVSVFLTPIQLYSDKNIPGAEGAMSKARKIIEHFTKSTQAMKKLLNFQQTSNLAIYNSKGYIPKKLLQDVITRWWSTYRALKRLRLLRVAINSLREAEEVDCPSLTDEQWAVLHQIEIALKMMATWQRLLEGDKYPTGSLVVMAIYQIRAHYVKVLNSEQTEEPVKRLCKILLEDFDERYVQEEGHEGKVRFSREPETGKGNRYVGVHPSLFIAAYLDPRVRKGLKTWMVPEQFSDLRSLVLDLMVDVAKANGTDDDAEVNEGRAVTNDTGGMGFAFDGAFDFDSDSESNNASTEENIRIRCEAQLSAYELSSHMAMKDAEGNYNDPLQQFWKPNASQYPELAVLAKEYLPSQATSAPSERIWSRAGRVIAAKRSCIDPEVTTSTIFVQENSRLIRKHWNELMPGKDLVESYLLPPFEDKDENGDAIDVGQGDD